jgi:hypothetical protein
MTLQAFEISKATAALRNAAFELPPRKLPWYAVEGVAGVSLVATDEACEFFKVLPGRRPPTTVGRFVAHIWLDHAVWLDSGIPRENLDLRLEDGPIFEPVHIMKLILLCRSRYDTFPIGPGSALEIPVYWDLAVIGLEARPLTGALRRTENVPLCMACLAMSLNNHEEAIELTAVVFSTILLR